jgi:anti-anti-sigma factor
MVEVEVAQLPEGHVLVRLAGEIDMSHGAPVQRAFRHAFEADGAAVVIDLCGVRFLAVAGADWVDAAVSALRGQGRAVRVVCADQGPVWRIVCLLGLDRRWPVHHDVTRAVASLRLDDGGEPDVDRAVGTRRPAR